MKISYTEGHDGDGNWVVDEEKEEQIKGFSIEELIDRLKTFAADHPNAFIGNDTQIYLTEWLNEDKTSGCDLYFRAEGDELPEKKKSKPICASSDNPHDLDYAFWH